MTPDELARFHDGDLLLFDRLVRDLSPRLLALLRTYANDPDDGADLLQDTWLRAFERRRDFRGAGSLLGWLLVIGRNFALARRRRAQLAPMVPADDGLLASLRDAGPDPLAGAAAAEHRRLLREAVLALPQLQHDVVLLRVLEDRTTRETAAAPAVPREL
jgi:RNA polymerase sigma-70 factor (ECF subfamily)